MSKISGDSNGRKQFDAIDMLRQAMGLPTPEGYAVITKEFAGFLVQELERLYAKTEKWQVDEALANIAGVHSSVDSSEIGVVRFKPGANLAPHGTMPKITSWVNTSIDGKLALIAIWLDFVKVDESDV